MYKLPKRILYTIFLLWFNQQTTMENQQQNDYSQDGLTNISKNLVKPTPFNRNKLFP